MSYNKPDLTVLTRGLDDIRGILKVSYYLDILVPPDVWFPATACAYEAEE